MHSVCAHPDFSNCKNVQALRTCALNCFCTTLLCPQGVNSEPGHCFKGEKKKMKTGTRATTNIATRVDERLCEGTKTTDIFIDHNFQREKAQRLDKDESFWCACDENLCVRCSPYHTCKLATFLKSTRVTAVFLLFYKHHLLLMELILN